MQASSTAEAKQEGIPIFPTKKNVPDDLGGDEAEGDAIATIAERKIRVRILLFGYHSAVALLRGHTATLETAASSSRNLRLS